MQIMSEIKITKRDPADKMMPEWADFVLSVESEGARRLEFLTRDDLRRLLVAGIKALGGAES